MTVASQHSLTHQLARRVLEMRGATLPGEVTAKVRQHLLDGIASAFIGCRNEVFGDLQTVARVERPGSGGDAAQLSGENLAMLWSYAVNGSVSEDGSKEGASHPAAVIIPVVMAFGRGQSRQRVENAIVAGYEVMIRIARAGNPLLARKGFHGTALAAPFGAAATLSQLLDLDEDQTRSALNLAAVGGAGLMASFKNGATQPLQVGWSVRNGVSAALLAARGHRGYDRILEEGFFPAFLGAEPAALMSDLLYPFAVMGCYLKPYPGCRHMHASLDAFSTIMDEQRLQAEQIAAIKVGTYRIALETGIRTLNSRGDAYFNIPYALAVRAVLGRADYDAFDERHFEHPEVVRLRKAVTEQVDEELEGLYPRQRGSRVEVQLLDGSIRSHVVHYPLGEPESPLPLSATRGKFMSCTFGMLSEVEQSYVMEQLERDDVNGFPDEFYQLLVERLFLPH